MKVYLAGRYGDLPVLRDVAYLLLMAGHQVTSRWLQGNPDFQDTEAERAAGAAMDYEDIDACEQFVLYNHEAPALRQGHSVELGIAIGKRGNWQKTPVITIVGERSDNVFHWMPQVEHFADWYAWFEHLKVPGTLLSLPPTRTPVLIVTNGAGYAKTRSIDASQIT